MVAAADFAQQAPALVAAAGPAAKAGARGAAEEAPAASVEDAPPAVVAGGGGSSVWRYLRPSSAAEVPERYEAAVPTLDALRAGAHGPLLMTADPGHEGFAYGGCKVASDPSAPLPINDPNGFDFDGPLLHGRIVVHINGLPSTDAAVFAGRRRTIHAASQVRFKTRVRAVDFVMGQEFHTRMAPGVEWFADHILRACAKLFSKTVMVDAYGDNPHFLNPVMAACQRVNVSRDGEQPDLWTAPEDCRLLAPGLAAPDGGPMCADKRRKWCDVAANMRDVWLEPGLVYTFHAWQHIIDFADYRASVGGLVSADLTRLLFSQPLGIMCKDLASGRAGYSLLMWHERLLYPEEYAAARREKKAAAAAAGKAAASAALAAGAERFMGGVRAWLRV